MSGDVCKHAVKAQRWGLPLCPVWISILAVTPFEMYSHWSDRLYTSIYSEKTSRMLLMHKVRIAWAIFTRTFWHTSLLRRALRRAVRGRAGREGRRTRRWVIIALGGSSSPGLCISHTGAVGAPCSGRRRPGRPVSPKDAETMIQDTFIYHLCWKSGDGWIHFFFKYHTSLLSTRKVMNEWKDDLGPNHICLFKRRCLKYLQISWSFLARQSDEANKLRLIF